MCFLPLLLSFSPGPSSSSSPLLSLLPPPLPSSPLLPPLPPSLPSSPSSPFLPFLHFPSNVHRDGPLPSSKRPHDSAKLPLAIKEKDVEYQVEHYSKSTINSILLYTLSAYYSVLELVFLLFQFHRVVIFSRLLESYPYSRDRIISEALTDVCPLVRGEVWAALLGVKVGGWEGQCSSPVSALPPTRVEV